MTRAEHYKRAEVALGNAQEGTKVFLESLKRGPDFNFQNSLLALLSIQNGLLTALTEATLANCRIREVDDVEQ